MHQFLFCVQRLSAKLLWPRPSGIRDGNSSSRSCSSCCLATVLGHWNATEQLYKPVTVYFTPISCHCSHQIDAGSCWVDWLCLNILHFYPVHLTTRVRLSPRNEIALVTGVTVLTRWRWKHFFTFGSFLARLVDLWWQRSRWSEESSWQWGWPHIFISRYQQVTFVTFPAKYLNIYNVDWPQILCRLLRFPGDSDKPLSTLGLSFVFLSEIFLINVE